MFVVRDGVLLTPDRGVLEGITRTVDQKHPAYDTMLATFKTI